MDADTGAVITTFRNAAARRYIVWYPAARKPLWILAARIAAGSAPRFALPAAGRYLAVCGGTRVLVYDLRARRLVRVFPTGVVSEPRGLMWNRTGDSLAAWGDRGLAVMTVRSGRVHTLTAAAVLDAALRPHGGVLAVCTRCGTVLRSAQTGRVIAELPGADGPPRHEPAARVCWSPDGGILALAGAGPPVLYRVGLDGYAAHIAGPGAYCSGSASAQTGDVAAPRRRAAIIGASDRASAARWSPDGERLAVAYETGMVAAWSRTGALVGAIAPRGSAAVAARLRWNPSGAVLAMSVRGRSMLWDSRSGDVVQVPGRRPLTAVWAAGGRLLIVRSRCRVDVVDARAHSVLATFTWLSGSRFRWCAVTRDGHYWGRGETRWLRGSAARALGGAQLRRGRRQVRAFLHAWWPRRTSSRVGTVAPARDPLVYVGAIAPRRSVADRVDSVLAQDGVSAVIEGSFVYGIRVKQGDYALARSIVSRDAAQRRYWFKPFGPPP